MSRSRHHSAHHGSDHRERSRTSSSSPILKDLFRTALDVLTDSSSSSSRGRRDESDRDLPHPRRSYTQPEPQRHREDDRYAGIPSHSYPRDRYQSPTGEALQDVLKRAAYELSKLVSDFEEKLGRRRNKRRSKSRGPTEFENDDDRFEELSDSEPENHTTSRGARNTRAPPYVHTQDNTYNNNSHHYQGPTGGLADEYYMAGAVPPARHSTYPYGNGYHYPQAYQQASPQYGSPASNPADPMHARPKPKRSSTSTSKVMKVGGDILRNLPELIERAGSRSSGYSGLLTALDLVVELYRQFGDRDSMRR
ncbi:hypothetical protein BDZ91DRAFT_754508 [Kalaharituber pfeilii]|nr:hypothetical protein BDZ91DRAFT_754508 [Kalaharituber pfeilii]